MGTTEESLARTRVENRRSSRGWRSTEGGPEEGGASLETAPFLARAASLSDTAKLQPGNRVQGPKRLVMRALRFFTDRQVQFNRNIVQVLTGLSDRLGVLAASDDRARRQLKDLQRGLEEQSSRIREQEDRVESLQTGLRVASEDGGGLPTDLAGAGRKRGLHSRRVGELYRRFEERFRGSAEMVRERVELYVPRIGAAVSAIDPPLPVLDVGCGRGELLAALLESGIRAEGVEANDTMAEACTEAGLPVRRGDLFQDLAERASGSLAAVTAIQVVEHFGPEELLRFLELVRDKLAPAGLLVLETIDVRTLFALRWYFADPTHNLPLMPETLSFWVEAAGFGEIEVEGLHPVELPDGMPDPGLAPVADVVFGTQDFALFARSPAR